MLDRLLHLLLLILSKLLHPTLDDRVCLGVGLSIRLKALACVPEFAHHSKSPAFRSATSSVFSTGLSRSIARSTGSSSSLETVRGIHINNVSIFVRERLQTNSKNVPCRHPSSEGDIAVA